MKEFIDIVIGVPPASYLGPMFAARGIASPDSLVYPLLASPKFDGMRCLVFPGGRVHTRSQGNFVSRRLPDWLDDVCQLADRRGIVLDGELYSPTGRFADLQSALMGRHEAILPDDLTYHVFDAIDVDEWEGRSVTPYASRLRLLFGLLSGVPHAAPVPQRRIGGPDELRAVYSAMLKLGYEGAITRAVDGVYHHGHCAHGEDMARLKPVRLFDAVVIAAEPRKTQVVARVQMRSGVELCIGNFSRVNQRGIRPGRVLEFAASFHRSGEVPRFGRFARWRDDLEVADVIV